jgi:hydrogenase maturation protein HypF
MSVARCAIDVRGLVQGVGFRPFVYGLARRFALGGLVYNGAQGVHIEVEGEQAAIDDFLGELLAAPPSPAFIEKIECQAESPLGERAFLIQPSHEPDLSKRSPGSGAGSEDSDVALVAPDSATCDSCLRELFDPRDRRYLHPFINCTGCGPRATIIGEMPYDRERTTMASFRMCPACEREYEDPTNRRFHAQPIACPGCGPRLRLAGPSGVTLATEDPLGRFAEIICSGGIGALKGLGGFHLVCDATNDATVAELRRGKNRPRKPFAIMVSGVAEATKLAVVDRLAARALDSAARPIVLVPSRPGTSVARGVAPGGDTLGILTAYAPVHHLLLSRVAGRPLVVTSGNAAGAPIASTDEEAVETLGEIADAFLTHDRPIELRIEDSVVRPVGLAIVPVRRSRGFSPLPIELGFSIGTPTLALGGHLKAVFAFGRDRSAVLAPHIGDLTSYQTFSAWSRAIEHFEKLLRWRPTELVHDLHPDYASTRYAEERQLVESARPGDGVELVGVQHHHAHLASCMAEHGLSGDVIGVCFDGTGYGEDGVAWGGEFLVGGYAHFDRAAHLAPVSLPGGDRAAREPWRMAVAHARAAGSNIESTGMAVRLDRKALAVVEQLVGAPSCARTTSVGRLFDAVAALTLGLDVSSYEGEAGMLLEALAERCDSGEVGAYGVEVVGVAPLVVDPAPLVRAVIEDVARGTAPEVVARRFHNALVEMVVHVCERIRENSGLRRVCLSGGVFANAVLVREIPVRLARAGFTVFQHRRVPPNDGGLCLGQLAVAAHGGGRRRSAPVLWGGERRGGTH